MPATHLSRIGLLTALALLTLVCGPAARAQLVSDGGTLAINGFTTNISPANLIVGDTGSNTRLVITNGGEVDDVSAYLGFNSSSGTNQLTVTGSGSVWNNSGSINIGNAGDFNTLLITNGGRVTNVFASIGDSAGADRNQTIVNGAGSIWDSSGFIAVGYSGSFNSLFVSNQGTVNTSGGYLGYNPGTSDNQVTVSGTNSVWNSSLDLSVGEAGVGNTLLITTGGKVSGTTGFVGHNSGALSNRVTVTGAGSLWNNSGTLSVGESGSFNSLLITNGGQAANAAGFIGYNTEAATNQVTVSGANSLWAVSGTLFVGNFGPFNTLLVTNGGSVNNSLNGAIGVRNDAAGNRATVSGAGSVWSSGGDLLVGDRGSFNTLLITNGGGASNTLNGVVGNRAIAADNLAIVSGAGSVWSSGGFLFVGNLGSVNALLVTNGGNAFSTDGYIGLTPNASGNQVIVSGTNSLWSMNGTNSVGFEGSFNSLLVTNGGRVSNDIGFIGYTFSSSSNLATVTGAGSTWISSSLSVGDSGSFNTLVITNGGQVSTVEAFVGFISGAVNNQAIVSGTNSAWFVTNSPYIGYDSTLNTLLITNGGTVRNFDSILGFTVIASNNQAIVAGPGSLWTNRGDLYVGFNGSFNLLLITNGGRVVNNVARLSNLSTAGNNQAIVSGANSAWSSADLRIGQDGPFNALVVSNGGTVFATNNVIMGFNPGSIENRATVAGGTLRTTNATTAAALDIRRGTNVLNAGIIEVDRLRLTNAAGVFEFNGGTLITRVGTVNNGQNFVVGQNSGFAPATWDVRSNSTATTLSSGLYVGALAANASLLITNGGTLSDTFGVLGQFSSSNLASVSGTNSRWNNSSSSIVGSSGSFNTMLITKAGKVTGAAGFVGDSGSSLSNRVVVGETNSSWSSVGDITIGNNGAFNSLLITNGGGVTNVVGYLGRMSSGNSNLAVVSGPGAIWNNSSSSIIGSSGSFNTLLITNGGKVTAAAGLVGDAASSLRNQVIVGDANSSWSSAGDISVGNNGSFNVLLITNGGSVSNVIGYLGRMTSGNSNQAVVSGASSVWRGSGSLSVGEAGDFNTLTITNGGAVHDTVGNIGSQTGANGNQVIVSNNGSAWNLSSGLNVGRQGSTNSLLIVNGGAVNAASANVGALSPSAANRLTVTGGTLRVTNATATAVLDIRGGTNVLNSGVITADSLSLSDPLGQFEFNGGAFNGLSAAVANGTLFTVGNGSSAATYNMSGATASSHSFANGLRVANNASLTGNGTVSGTLTVAGGGTLAPGLSVGKIVLNNSPTLQGNITMEISKTGVTLTNDQVQVGVALTYGGSLTVSKLGPDPLTSGNSFPLFSAASYSGALASISLPALSTGLSWTNRMLVNGTITVVNKSAPNITGLTRSGTNLIFNVTGGSPGGAWYRLTTTNVALPLSNWTTNASGIFDWLGNVTLTNGINFAEPQRYFRIYAP